VTPGSKEKGWKMDVPVPPGIDDAHASATPALRPGPLPDRKIMASPTSIHRLSGSLIAKVRELHIEFVATYKAKAPQTQ
jgi:hypothetical protein